MGATFHGTTMGGGGDASWNNNGGGAIFHGATMGGQLLMEQQWEVTFDGTTMGGGRLLMEQQWG